MSLYKAQVTYITMAGVGARATCVLSADDDEAAKLDAQSAVKATSRDGVKEFRSVVLTRNTLGVEFLGPQPA